MQAQLDASAQAVQQSIDAAATTPPASGWTSGLVIWLSLSILLFGLAIIGIMAYLIYKDCDPRGVLRAFCVPLIVVSAIFLVVTGYSQEQITPVIGLLGTIAGYLLGSRDRVHPGPPGDGGGGGADGGAGGGAAGAGA